MKEIRNLQETYKMTYGRYAGDIDSLVLGLKEGKLPVVKKYGNVPDEMTEAEALAKGIIRRDTVFMNPLEKMREEGKTAMTDEQLIDYEIIENKDIDYLNQIKQKMENLESNGEFTTNEGRKLLRTFQDKVESRTR